MFKCGRCSNLLKEMIPNYKRIEDAKASAFFSTCLQSLYQLKSCGSFLLHLPFFHHFFSTKNPTSEPREAKLPILALEKTLRPKMPYNIASAGSSWPSFWTCGPTRSFITSQGSPTKRGQPNWREWGCFIGPRVWFVLKKLSPPKKNRGFLGGGGFKCCLFSQFTDLWGFMIQFDEHIFQG